MMTPGTKDWISRNLSVIVSTLVILAGIAGLVARMETNLAQHERRIHQLEIDHRDTVKLLGDHFKDANAHFTPRDQTWRDGVTRWLERIDAKLERHMEMPNTPITKK